MKILFGKPHSNDWLLNLSKYGNIMKLYNIISINMYVLKNNIDLLVPTTFEQMNFIYLNTDVIKCKTYVNSVQNTNLFNSKCCFAKFMEENNMSQYIPKTYYNSKYDKTLASYIRDMKLPFIIKADNLCAGNGCYVFTENNYDKDLLQNDYFLKKYNNIIIQEFIDGQNLYAGHFFVINGKIIFDIYYIETHEQKYMISKGKMKKYNTYTAKDKHIAIFKHIFEFTNYNGFACIDFKIDDCDDLKIFEINPRMGGTFATNISDFPKMMDSLIQYFESH
jgi:glutathione synthase/RimK-type ligase-like ATP-grasp enzyme